MHNMMTADTLDLLARIASLGSCTCPAIDGHSDSAVMMPAIQASVCMPHQTDYGELQRPVRL